MNDLPDLSARRTRLREYQTQLLERVQAARTSRGQRASLLGVQAGGASGTAPGQRLLLDLAQAGEIVTAAPLTRVPLTQPWYLGLANIRGNLIGVIDIARYLGVGETVAGPHSRIVTLAPGLGLNCALLVSRVYGLRDAGAMHEEDGMLRDGEGNEWTPLDLAKLVKETRFLHIGM
ncbi:MAG TPA: chemotaxis protein CheW [Telluria sp.]|nr:chemotaxis protein CheW [Telluria sp.]